MKMPFVGESHDHNLASSLLDVICDHRVRPPMKMPITLGEGQNMVCTPSDHLIGRFKLVSPVD